MASSVAHNKCCNATMWFSRFSGHLLITQEVCRKSKKLPFLWLAFLLLHSPLEITIIRTAMVALVGSPAMNVCKLRQARKGATVAGTSCAGVWLMRAAT